MFDILFMVHSRLMNSVLIGQGVGASRRAKSSLINNPGKTQRTISTAVKGIRGWGGGGGQNIKSSWKPKEKLHG